MVLDWYMPGILTVSIDRSSLPFKWHFYQENIPEQVKICPGKNAGTFCDYNTLMAQKQKPDSSNDLTLYWQNSSHLVLVVC